MGMKISVMWEQPLFNRILILNYGNVGIKGLFMQLIVPKEICFGDAVKGLFRKGTPTPNIQVVLRARRSWWGGTGRCRVVGLFLVQFPTV